MLKRWTEPGSSPVHIAPYLQEMVECKIPCCRVFICKILLQVEMWNHVEIFTKVLLCTYSVDVCIVGVDVNCKLL